MHLQMLPFRGQCDHRKAYGSAYVAMNSKAVGADLTYAWEDASIGMMDAKLAAKIMYLTLTQLR